MATKTKKAKKKPVTKAGKSTKGDKGGKEKKKDSKKTTAAKSNRQVKTNRNLPTPLMKKQAAVIDLTVGQLTVLKAIAKSPQGISYKQIFKRTGIYNPLTAMCRPTHDGSLGTLEYITEEEHDINNRDTLIFKITALGAEAIKKAAAVK